MRLYEAGLPGTGQSAGESRIFRHAHDDPRLVAFACESRGVWDGWAEHFYVELISSDGVVAIGDSALERLRVLDQVGGVEAREIDAAEVAQRMPLLAGYAGPAVLDELGGAIRTRTVIEALAGALAHAVTTPGRSSPSIPAPRGRSRCAASRTGLSTPRWWCAQAAKPLAWHAASACCRFALPHMCG